MNYTRALTDFLIKNPHLSAVLLFIPNILFYVAVAIRNFLYNFQLLKINKLDQRCISVGNLAFGGTGKTPFLILVGETLCRNGENPVILTRGYGAKRKTENSFVVLNGTAIFPQNTISPDNISDEVLLMSAKLPDVPIVVGPKRFLAAQAAIKHADIKPSVWILDDGYQHRQIHRDIDILLIGPNQPELSLLSSLHREPWSNHRRATLIAFTAPGISKKVNVNCPVITAPTATGELRAVSRAAQELWQNEPNHKKIVAACAIANPQRFIRSLKSSGFNIIDEVILGDHRYFTEKNLKRFARYRLPIVITEKDYFRQRALWQECQAPIFTLPINIELSDADKRTLELKLGSLR